MKVVQRVLLKKGKNEIIPQAKGYEDCGIIDF